MKIGLHGGAEADHQDITALERIINQKLDRAFLEFVARHDGATPDANSYPVDGVPHMGSVRKFIPISDIPNEWKEISDSSLIFPGLAYPIAVDDCGNYTIMDQSVNRGVFFWDHELDKISKVANSFTDFVEMIEPFQISEEVKANFKPIRVWVDPSFKPEF